MKRSFLKRIWIALTMAWLLTACAPGTDAPFIYPAASPEEPSENPPPPAIPCETDEECDENQKCQDNVCVSTLCETDEECAADEKCHEGGCIPKTEEGCTDDTDCEVGSICEEAECVAGCPTTPCATGEVCNVTTHRCQVEIASGTCDVNFNATLELRSDAPTNAAGHEPSDIPPLCTEYQTFLDHPNTDLHCCHNPSEDPGTDPHGRRLECDPAPEHLAITRWAASGPMKLKFDLSSGGCRVFLSATDFPEFQLENSALDASLLIDAGRSSTDPRLRDSVAVSDCSENANGEIEINGLPMQFMVRLFNNLTQCQLQGRSDCAPPAFSQWFSNSSPASSPMPEDSFQVIPGFANEPFLLTTGSDSEAGRSGVAGVGTITASGIPIRRNAAGETELRLVTAFRMPANSSDSGTPNPDLGTGLLTGPLADAVMTAEIGGTVTNPNKTDGTILSLADLAQNCGSGTTGGPGETLALSASISIPVEGGESITEDLPITGDAASEIVIDVCLPGTHLNGDCVFLSSSDQPFAKEEGVDPLYEGMESRFEKPARISLTIGSGSNANLDLNLPLDSGSAFQFTQETIDLLNDAILAPVTSSNIDLDLVFKPKTAGIGCTTVDDRVTCTANGPGAIIISQTPRILLNLRGEARAPSGSLKLEELDLSRPEASTATLFPVSSGNPLLSFTEQIIGFQTETKLLKASNVGVRPLELDAVRSTDNDHNFRIGSIYQGRSFAVEDRTWRVNAESWSIPPDGSQDLYFFLSYGPFAQRPVNSESRRFDQAQLRLEMGDLVNPVDLEGTAKLDRRAELALLVQDETRFTAEGGCAGDCVSSEAGEHLYPAKNLLFSLRQDGTPDRAVYLRNNTGLGEDLKIRTQPTFVVGAGAADKFEIIPTDLTTVAGCATIDEAEPRIECTLAPQRAIKIASVSFDAATGGDYRVYEVTLPVDAVSLGSSGSTSRPKILGGEPAGSPEIPTFALKGANGAPDGTRDLLIHRLVSGMDFVLPGGTQRSLIASTTTPGVLERYRQQQGLTSVDPNYVDRYRLQDGLILDATRGTATLMPVFTPVDANFASPLPSEALGGIRLFNGPGTNPGQLEYRIQCERFAGADCAHLYLYIASWEAADVVPAGPGCVAGKSAIESSPASGLANVLNPQLAGESDCMRDFLENFEPARTEGSFDPVTGEISFRNLAVRLFGPSTSLLGDVDSVLQLSLTTECVTAPTFVPDPDAQASRLVPTATLEADDFDPVLMGPNPISLFTGDNASIGTDCPDPSNREIHGRRLVHRNSSDDLVNLDLTGTFDGSIPEGSASLNFDLAGLGKLSSTASQAQNKMMYIVIKAEIP